MNQTPDAAETAPASRRTYLAILCLLAFSFMLFQFAVLRELRFQLTTLFTLTPFLFSTVIFCIALGSLCASRVASRSRDVLRWSALLLPVIAPLLFASTIAIAQALLGQSPTRFEYGPSTDPTGGDSYLHSTIFAFVAVAVGGYGFVFFLQGLLFSIYFREGREQGVLSNVYGADLVASGLGALAGGALNFFCSPAQLVLIASAVFLATLWISFRHLGIRAPLVVAATGLVAGMIAMEAGSGFLSRIEDPKWLRGRTFSLWSRYRRIDVTESAQWLQVYADGVIFQPYQKQDKTYDGDFRRLPVDVIRTSPRPVRDLLIVGSGSGADVRILRDLVPGKLDITAVELDQGFVDAARNIPWLWNYYRTADIVVQEGRYFLENTRKEFDLVLYAFIDPQSAISSIGIPDANFLYTDAGMRAAYARLREGGTLIISRVYLEQEQDAFVGRMCATLESAGIPTDSIRVYRRPGSNAWAYYGRLSVIHVVARKGGTPPDLAGPMMTPLAWSRGHRPTTDLFPFSLGTGIWFDTLLRYVGRNALPLLLLAALVLGVGAAAATSLSRFNFLVLGFGSFLLESLVLFNSFLLFGDPNLSAALAIGLFLLWNGVGSLLSVRVENRKWLYLAVPAVILVYGVSAPMLNAATIATAPSVRSLAFMIHLSLGGMAAGMMFPIALRRFPEKPVAGLFFMDVIGCALAPPIFWLAMSTTGLWIVIAGAALSYAVVSVVLLRRPSAP